MPFISIIIPVYNNQISDIQRCFDSILAQDYSDYEVIVVNDGSEDWCANYLNDFVKIHKQFKIINQQNQGVSTARNNGVKSASGEYITFVDADDVIVPYFLRNFSKRLISSNEDIIYGFVKYCNNVDDYISSNLEAKENSRFFYIEKDKLYSHLIDLNNKDLKSSNFGYLSRGPIARLIKRGLILDVPFNKNLQIGEDSIWNLNLLQKANSYSVCKDIVYIYIYNESSVTKDYNIKQITRYNIFLEELWSYIVSEDLKANYLKKSMEGIRELADSYFSKNNKSFYTNYKTFNRLVRSKPWSNSNSLKYAIRLNKKDFIKYLLLQCGLYYPVYWVYQKYLKVNKK